MILLADALYVVSTTLGNLVLVAVLSAAHPVVTRLWARLHGGERLGPVRIVGVALTILGVVAATAL